MLYCKTFRAMQFYLLLHFYNTHTHINTHLLLFNTKIKHTHLKKLKYKNTLNKKCGFKLSSFTNATLWKVRTFDPRPVSQELGSLETFGICSEGKLLAHTGLLFYSLFPERHTRSPLLHNLCPQRAGPGIL